MINEIWRASDQGPKPISESLKSVATYECYRAVQSSRTFQEALQKFNSTIQQSKGNSMVAEFAKRVIPVSFQSKSPAREWPKNFLSEVTSYIVSRDLSGFVGKSYRNQTVKELVAFKKRLSDRVKEVVGSHARSIQSETEWAEFIDNTIDKLKKGE